MEEQWYDTAGAMLELTEQNFTAMKIPQRLAKTIERLLAPLRG